MQQFTHSPAQKKCLFSWNKGKEKIRIWKMMVCTLLSSFHNFARKNFLTKRHTNKYELRGFCENENL